MTSPLPQPGTLYVVATPLGNLEDLTYRAARLLAEVDLIAAEDTRQTRKLLGRYGISTPLTSLHGHSREGAVRALVARLQEGQAVAYVSDAGTPGVSDPGAELVTAAREAGVPVVPIPGPSAPATIFSVAGVSAPGFIFAGYPPRSAGERREWLQRWTALELPLVLFESPHRISDTLAALADTVPNRQLIIGRELTKQFEQIVAGRAEEMPGALSAEQVRGEFVLVLEGEAAVRARPAQGEAEVEEAVRLLGEAGVPGKTVARVLQLLAGMSRNEAYRAAMGGEG